MKKYKITYSTTRGRTKETATISASSKEEAIRKLSHRWCVRYIYKAVELLG